MNDESESKTRGALIGAYSLSLIGHGIVFLFLWSGVWLDWERLPVPAILEVELQEPIRFEARALGPVPRPRSLPTSVTRLNRQGNDRARLRATAGVDGQAGKTPGLSPEGRSEETRETIPSAKPSRKLPGARGENDPSPPPPSSNPSSSQAVPVLLDPYAPAPGSQATAQRGLGEHNGKANGKEALTGVSPASDAVACCPRSGGEEAASKAGALAEGLRPGIGNGTGEGPGGGEERSHGGPTGVGDLDGLLLEYLHNLQRRISEHKFYPLRARRLGIEGTVTVGLTIRCDGQLDQVELIHGVPFTVLNMAAVETVQKVAPLPPLPLGTCQERMRVLIPFAYRLER